MTRRRIVSTALVAVCAGGALSAAPVSAGSAPAACNVLDLSPSFAKDGTALCVGTHKERIDQPATGVDVYLTTNGGRTWQRRTATGLPFTTSSQWRQVVFSATYATDKTIYVQERSGGLYATTDGGATFAVADPLAIAGDDLPNVTAVTTTVGGLPAGSLPSAVAYAGSVPAVLSPPVHRPVPGSGPLQAKSFLIPRSFPDRPGYLVSLVPSLEGTAAYKVFSCDATFT